MHQRYLDRAPRLTARIAALLGILALANALLRRPSHLLSVFDPILPAPARATAEAAVAVSGLLLLRIAAGLRKRKRTAWQLAVAACLAMAAADLLSDERRPVEAVLTIGLLVALLLARSRFTALPDRRSRWFALRVALQFLAVAVGYGLVLLYLPGHVPRATTLGDRCGEVVASLVGLGGSLHVAPDGFADALHATLLGFALLALTCSLVLLLRAAEPVAVLSAGDEHALRDLLDRHGDRDSLGYFALRRDKAVVWSASGKAAITYRVVLGVALVSGDPIGDPEAWPGAIAAYRQLVDEYGWTPAVMGCSELGATVFQREYGLAALAFGDEAILDVAEFSLAGRSMRGVRQACTRATRAGYTTQIRRVADLSQTQIAELRAATNAWRVDAVERGYSMALSRLGDVRDPGCLVVTARRNETLHGLLHFVPWGPRGISLDLMRRDRGSDNGVNEYMIAELLAAAPSLDIDRVSLNFAVFREALERGAHIGAGPVLRLWRRVLLIASKWWQIDSLFRFNAKFRPRWEPRYFCYPAARDIPRVALAALEAEAFVVPPPVVKRLLGRG